jgi:hypothetical protein
MEKPIVEELSVFLCMHFVTAHNGDIALSLMVRLYQCLRSVKGNAVRAFSRLGEF